MDEAKIILKSKSEEDWKKLPAEVHDWFRDAVGNRLKPSLEACTKLARAFQIIVNRCINAELERRAEQEGAGPVPLEKLKDVSPAEYETKRVEKFMDAANQLLAEAEELESYFGGYQWMDSKGPISLEEIQNVLWRIGAVPKAQIPSLAARGRPEEVWHSAGRDIARVIRNAMREVGLCEKRLNMKSEESVTANVGAKAINWFFNNVVEIQAEGFATAMQQRKRRKNKQKSLSQRLPEVMRIKIL